jgi:hypothetical protein
MILVDLNHLEHCNPLLASAHYLSTKLDKKLAFTFAPQLIKSKTESLSEEDIRTKLTELGIDDKEYPIFERHDSTLDYTHICEELEASLLLIQEKDGSRKDVMSALKACRELRIPYIYFKDMFNSFELSKVLLPVGYLEEEVEKAQFGAAFGRFCNSEVRLLQANDYGTKAEVNTQKIATLFNKFQFIHVTKKGEKDSFKIDYEAMIQAQRDGFGIILVSASRDYGLDDIIFGPKEYHLLKKSTIPILLINPRGDLYTLCD